MCEPFLHACRELCFAGFYIVVFNFCVGSKAFNEHYETANPYRFNVDVGIPAL